MKKVLVLMVVLLLAFLTSGAAAAGGAQYGTGPRSLCEVVGDFTYTGIVEDCLESGGGLLLLTEGDGEVVVYGIGPARYWDGLGVDRPAVDDEITVDGYIVACSGTERYILTSVEIPVEGGVPVTVLLRDPDTGLPLWGSRGRTGDGPYGPAYGKEGDMGQYGPGYGKNGDMGEYGPGYGKNGDTGHYGPGPR